MTRSPITSCDSCGEHHQIEPGLEHEPPFWRMGSHGPMLHCTTLPVSDPRSEERSWTQEQKAGATERRGSGLFSRQVLQAVQLDASLDESGFGRIESDPAQRLSI
jgi:hypothetical protein